MAWSWSHTSEAYQNAELNLRDLPIEELRVISAEWFAHRPGSDSSDSEGFSEWHYKRELRQLARENESADELASDIWNWASESATCDNGGFNAWVCPYGCHTVPFDGKPCWYCEHGADHGTQTNGMPKPCRSVPSEQVEP